MRPLHLRLVERSQVADRIVDRGVDVGADGRSFELVGADPQPGRFDLDAVESGQRIAHGGIAPFTDIVDQRTDRASEVGVEDVIETTAHQGSSGRGVHLGPTLPAHHGHPADVTGAGETHDRATSTGASGSVTPPGGARVG